MIKNIVIGLLMVPYLFLATSVTDAKDPKKVKGGENCTVNRVEKYETFMGLAKVHYSGFGMFKNEYIILPKFLIKEDVFFADCPSGELMIGAADFIKVGEKIHVFTEINEIRIFGQKLREERNIMMFGTGWRTE